MKGRLLFLLLLTLLIGCSRSMGTDAVSSQLSYITTPKAQPSGQAQGHYISWGVYDLQIGRDGSYAQVNFNRTASGLWGYHLNVVKLLEVAPCTDCLKLSNTHLTADGDVSVDISIRHPWPADNKYCTGFDVMGIIMFPASQWWPDPDLWAWAAPEWPYTGWKRTWSSRDKGDAELINLDGWTSIFAPDSSFHDHDLDEGLPIFGYYPGKWASGENLGTINAFKRYYSTETRHMFEAGKTVSRTYIIRPPAAGPIQASYAIYAHWAPPVKTPVVNPATDFGPEANSPMPYEFYITQDAPIDPDAPSEVNGAKLHWHVKLWNEDFKTNWRAEYADLATDGLCSGGLNPDFSGDPDSYFFGDNGPDFDTSTFENIHEEHPDFLPNELPWVFRIDIRTGYSPQQTLCREYYLPHIAIKAPDGEW